MAVIEIYFVTIMAGRHHLLSSVFPVLGDIADICGTETVTGVSKLILKNVITLIHKIADELFRLCPRMYLLKTPLLCRA